MSLFAYTQQLDPLQGIYGSTIWSTVLAALPVLVLFITLVPMRWLAPKAGLAGSITALAIAIAVYGMPADMAVWSFMHGVGFGLLPVGITIFSAMLLYNITVETGQFTIIRRSVAGLSADARIQAILIGFSFGAFLEGAAGGGTPVAICGAIMVGLGFNPFLAAVLCLIALFTHIHIFWVAALLLAMIDFPDIGGTLGRIAGSVEKIAGVNPPEAAVEAPDAAAAVARDEHRAVKPARPELPQEKKKELSHA